MKSIFKTTLSIVILLATLVPSVQAGDIAVALDPSAAELAAIQANRASTIDSLVDQWRTPLFIGRWEEEFRAALDSATDAQLLAVSKAADYDAVRAILQGKQVPVNVEGLEIQDLGSLATDLTFTPNDPPCRILDTRYYGGGAVVPAGSVRSFYVHSTGGVAGGGDCPAPKGEPVGVALNLAAVTPQSASHLRVWPYGYTMPTVSYLNYAAGQNIANAGIISTAYLQGYDISIYNGSNTHYLADVMGYFYPAENAPPGLSISGDTTTIGTSCTNYGNGQVSITVPGPGYIKVDAQAWIILATNGSRYANIFIGNSPTDCTFADSSQGYMSMYITKPVGASSEHYTIPVSRTFYVSAAGTYTYYLNGMSDGTATFWFAGMQAIYLAD